VRRPRSFLMCLLTGAKGLLRNSMLWRTLRSEVIS
jgi:hypothetical protein